MVADAGIAPGGGGQLVSPRGAALALAAAVLLCWPMLLVSAPLFFFDTAGYWQQGRAAVGVFLAPFTPTPDVVNGAGGGGSAGGALDAAVDQVRGLRSAPYAFFVYVTSLTPLGLIGPVVLQTGFVLFLFWALVARELEAPRGSIALAAALVAVLSPLPWFASFLMPDLLAAGVILYALVLVRGFDALGLWQKLALVLVATFTVVVHYGHLPLAAACIGAALAVRLIRGRLDLASALAGVAPVLLAVAVNMGAGAVAFDGPSLAPRRLPLLLARSLQDGPARWHLQEHCAAYDYTICTVVPEIPDTIHDLMWAPGGIKSATDDEISAIRDEELVILWRAFQEYPLAQVSSLLGNAFIQTVSIGTEEILYAEPTRDAATGKYSANFDRSHPRGVLEAFGLLHIASILAGVAALAVMARRDGLRAGEREQEVLLVLAVGLLANAVIFGGLSAPVDRYQSRVAWLIPAIAALFWLERRRQALHAVPDGPTPQPSRSRA